MQRLNRDGFIVGSRPSKPSKSSLSLNKRKFYLNDVDRELRPLRIPLHSKRSKRCPACAHILIKPEQKAQSVRYKIKLVAGNYLPAITVALPHAQRAIAEAAKRSLGKSTSGPSSEEDKAAAGLHAGKTYQFHLALVNPLYDPITVRLSPQRMSVSTAGGVGGSSEKARRPPFAISLPNQVFSVAAFAEAWEYDDDEEMFGVEDEELGLRSGKDVDGRGGKVRSVGVLEKRANTTIIGGEVVIGKEARGNVKVGRQRFHGLCCVDHADWKDRSSTCW